MWNRKRIFKTLLVIVIAVVIPALFVMARAQERKRLGYEDLIPQWTFGGKQFWNDVHFFHGWHIQRNVVTGHHRLLDAEEKRHAWGTFEGCKKKLDEIRKEDNVPPMKGKAVIVMHGLGRSHKAMDPVADYLREEGGYKIFNVEYASTQHSTEENAKTLASVIESLDGIEEINFVGHSLGNIVVRRYLHDHIDPKTGKPTDKRIRRMVMLGPPNHGSVVAKSLADNAVFGVTGQTGQELGKGWDALEKNLATPPFEFGIIAGGKGDGEGYNPVLPGDDDGTIRIETARLRGATDFSRVEVLHSFLMNDKKVHEQTLRFLKHGYFKTEKERQPIK